MRRGSADTFCSIPQHLSQVLSDSREFLNHLNLYIDMYTCIYTDIYVYIYVHIYTYLYKIYLRTPETLTLAEFEFFADTF